MVDEFKESGPVLSEEIAILCAELTYFLDYTVAYENLTRRVPHENVRAFCSALVQSKKFGTPLVQSLKGLSKEIREAEVAARRSQRTACFRDDSQCGRHTGPALDTDGRRGRRAHRR